MEFKATRRGLLRRSGSAAIAIAGIGSTTNAVNATQNSGSHPMFQYDAANTGYNPNTSGPTKSVQQKWAFNAGEPIRSSPAVANNTVYFGHSSGMTFALNAKTGEQQWQTQTGAVKTGVAVSGDRVYVTAVSGGETPKLHLRSLFASNGTEIWEVPLGNVQNMDPATNWVDFSPVVIQNFILVGGETTQLVSTERGSTQWERGIFNFAGDGRGDFTDAENSFTSAGNAAFRGKRAYIHFDGKDAGEGDYSEGRQSRLTATNMKNREDKWVANAFTGVPLTVAESMIWGATGDLLYARSESNGKKQWEFRTGPVGASPAVAEGVVYVGSQDSKFYALSTQTGELEWLIPTDAPVRSAPIVADSAVYFGTDGGTMYAVDAKNGEQLWTFKTGGKVRSSPAVINGTLYIGSDDKTLYALTE